MRVRDERKKESKGKYLAFILYHGTVLLSIFFFFGIVTDRSKRRIETNWLYANKPRHIWKEHGDACSTRSTNANTIHSSYNNKCVIFKLLFALGRSKKRGIFLTAHLSLFASFTLDIMIVFCLVAVLCMNGCMDVRVHRIYLDCTIERCFILSRFFFKQTHTGTYRKYIRYGLRGRRKKGDVHVHNAHYCCCRWFFFHLRFKIAFVLQTEWWICFQSEWLLI